MLVDQDLDDEEVPNVNNSETILALSHQGSNLGACKFSSSGHLDMMMNSHCSNFDNLKQQVTSLIISSLPTIVLVSSKASNELVTFLKDGFNRYHEESDTQTTQPTIDPLNEDEDDPFTDPLIRPFSVEIRPANEFKFENGRKQIFGLNLPGQTELSIEAALQPSSNKSSFSAAGAILSYIAKDFLGLEGRVTHISLFSLATLMQLSLETIYSLAIFDAKAVRNSTSLFSLLNLTKTCTGKDMLKSWFLTPLQTIAAIEERQVVVSFFLDPANVTLIDDLQKALSKVSNIPKVLYRLRVKSIVNDWKALFIFLQSFARIHSIIEKKSIDSIPLLQQIARSDINDRLLELASLIDAKIDFQESANLDRISICQYVDKELDGMRRFYSGLESFLTTAASEMTVSVEFQLVYMASLGFLVKVDSNMQPDPSLSFQFSSDDSAFFKNKDMLELDLKIGDIHSLIVDLELKILQDIREEVMDIAQDIEFASSLVAELDCLLSFAKFARLNNYVKPIITDSDCLLLEKMRHPILEHFEERFVVNDIGLGFYEDQSLPKTLVITGPNASGKSVYLHQVALIVFMAHLGCFVPCEYAVVGLTDKILTRIRTKTSVSLRESTFQSDLKQACASITQCTPKSLVLLDEFGKGTSSSDGVGLFAATVVALIDKKTRLLAATHFHEVFTFSDFMNLTGVSFYSLETMVAPNEIAEFLYSLVPGRSKSSMGILCASNNGVKESVIERALSIASALEQGHPIPLLNQDKDMEAKGLGLLNFFLKLDLESCDLDDLFRAISFFEK